MGTIGFKLSVTAPERTRRKKAISATLTGLAIDAELGPTARIGTSIGVQVAGASAGSYQWATVEDGDIAGATGASFTPSAGQELRGLFCRVTVDGVDHLTPAATVRHAPPLVAGSLNDVTLTGGSGIQTFQTSAAFSGSGLSYALSTNPAPGAVSIDTAAGTMTVDTDAAGTFSLQSVGVLATNSGGTAETGFLLSVEQAPSVAVQTAAFGADTPAGQGAWRPVDASGNLVDIATFDTVTAGALGAHSPMVSGGAMSFSGPGGAPDGAVLRLTLADATQIDVAVQQVANRVDIATDAELAAVGNGAGGRAYVIRRNARLAGINETQFSLVDHDAAPITIEGEGAHRDAEFHISFFRVNRLRGLRLRNVNFERGNFKQVYFNYGNGAIVQGNIVVEGCWIRGPVIDSGPGGADESALISGGYGGLGHVPVYGHLEVAVDCEGVIIRNNRFDDCFISTSLTGSFYNEFAANWSTRAYFDHTKISIPEGQLTYEGNFFRTMTGRSGFADGPHPNFGIQSINDNITKVRFIHNMGNANVQGSDGVLDGPDTTVFHTMTGNNDGGGSTAGIRSYAGGNVAITDGTAQWSDGLADGSVYFNNLFLPWDRSSFPMTNISTQYGFNLTASVYDFGVKEIRDNIVMNAQYGGQTASLSGNVSWSAQPESWFGARFANWTTTVPALPDYGWVWGQALVNGSTDVSGKDPGQVFAPSSAQQPGSLYDYALPAEAAPAITIASATAGTGQISATLSTDRAGDHHAILWIVSADPVLSAEEMKLCARAAAHGYEVPVNGTAAMVAGGLGPGTYHVHAFQAIGAKVFGSATSGPLNVT